MIKSMTAFAGHELTQNQITVAVEIRTVNSRHLDIALRISPAYAVLEDKIRQQINACVLRGRVEIRINIKDESGSKGCYAVDWDRARSYLAVTTQLQQTFQLPPGLAVEHLASVPGIIQSIENTDLVDSHWPTISRCLASALSGLDRMRRIEGEYIQKDFSERLSFIEGGLASIETSIEGVLAAYQQKLETRIGKLTQGLIELDAARIAQEAAIMAERSDISEEILRARSHIEQFRVFLQAEEPAGRKINFLLQELNREFNTMGAKVGQAAMAHIIVDIKAELEKLREQVQNIE